MTHYTEKGFKVTTDDIVALLSCEAGGFDYWGIIQWKSKELYKEAKAEMIEKGIKPTFGDSYCLEDVEAYMIEGGYDRWHMVVFDFEEEKRYKLTMERLLRGFELNWINNPKDADIQEGDANTADNILQYAIFGELVYA